MRQVGVSYSHPWQVIWLVDLRLWRFKKLRYALEGGGKKREQVKVCSGLISGLIGECRLHRQLLLAAVSKIGDYRIKVGVVFILLQLNWEFQCSIFSNVSRWEGGRGWRWGVRLMGGRGSLWQTLKQGASEFDWWGMFCSTYKSIWNKNQNKESTTPFSQQCLSISSDISKSESQAHLVQILNCVEFTWLLLL